MDPTTPQTFSERLRRSRLLPAAELDQIERRLAADNPPPPELLADELVSKGVVTSWQAQQLLQGRHAFFLGKYKLLERLGGGGMGVVFKALQTVTGRIVALKVVSKSLRANPQAAARFQREVRVISSLNHPHIIAAYDADFVGDTCFLVMEFCHGRDLKAWLKEFGRLPADWSCQCIRQAALGLEHAHERGLVHRDIKPENLLVDTDPSTGRPIVKLLDMGLARLTGEDGDSGELTQTGQVLGTPDYIAPEQAEASQPADIRADIFSLGCTLFRMLTGRLPFIGADAMEKILARVTEDAPPLRTIRPDLPAELEAAVARMLARDPRERYQTPAEVADALAPFAQDDAAAGEQTLALNWPGAGAATTAWNPAGDESRSDVSMDAGSAHTISTTRGVPDSLMDQLTADMEPAAAPVTLAGAAPLAAAVPMTLPVRPHEPPRWIKGAVAGLLAAIAALALLGWWHGRGALLVIEWPLDQRPGARLDVDGHEFDLPAADPIEIPLDPGRHTVLVRRRGYEPIEWELSLASGSQEQRRIEWRRADLGQPFRMQAD